MCASCHRISFLLHAASIPHSQARRPSAWARGFIQNRHVFAKMHDLYGRHVVARWLNFRRKPCLCILYGSICGDAPLGNRTDSVLQILYCTFEGEQSAENRTNQAIPILYCTFARGQPAGNSTNSAFAILYCIPCSIFAWAYRTELEDCILYCTS